MVVVAGSGAGVGSTAKGTSLGLGLTSAGSQATSICVSASDDESCDSSSWRSGVAGLGLVLLGSSRRGGPWIRWNTLLPEVPLVDGVMREGAHGQGGCRRRVLLALLLMLLRPGQHVTPPWWCFPGRGCRRRNLGPLTSCSGRWPWCMHGRRRG